ncbi:MAG: glycoside hydrolase family 57 protein [Mucinivorans sp.]
MKNLCLYFQVHQPYRLKKYRFFNMGKDHFYFDDFLNRTVMQRVAHDSYLPMNALLLGLIARSQGKLRVAFSISGTAIEQFRQYAPEVIESFRALADTGCVEFLGETYAHSLASFTSRAEFEKQIVQHSDTIDELFGQRPKVFRNTELIYSDTIGEIVQEMGFEAMLTEGAKQILGWKSPNFIYANPIKQNLKLLLRNYKLSDDIAFRFANRGWAEYPLTADKYVSWLSDEENKGEIVNLFMDYETFGEHNKAKEGIFEFMEAFFNAVVASDKLQMKTPSQIAQECQSTAILHVPHPISWADEERDVSAWLGNELQDEAFAKLYALREKIVEINDPNMTYVFNALQGSDHFYYMCTKWFSDGDVHSYFNPYDSPYEAFMNYMNVLSDFQREVQKLSK